MIQYNDYNQFKAQPKIIKREYCKRDIRDIRDTKDEIITKPNMAIKIPGARF